jgi:cytochrome P450
LQAVVKELFRLHPPAPFSLPHELVASADASLQQVDEDGESSQLLGYDILQVPQTQVFINIYAVNRDPSVWERPNEFHPDRFLQGPDDQNKLDLVGCKNDSFMLLPFGAGRRQCPGARLAILFVQLGLANQLHSWNRRSSCRIFTAAAARTSTYNRRSTL